MELVVGPAEELVDARVDGLIERLEAVGAAPRLAFLRPADCLESLACLTEDVTRDEQRRAATAITAVYLSNCTPGDQLTITCIRINERAHSLHSAPFTVRQPLPAAQGRIAEQVAPRMLTIFKYSFKYHIIM